LEVVEERAEKAAHDSEQDEVGEVLQLVGLTIVLTKLDQTGIRKVEVFALPD